MDRVWRPGESEQDNLLETIPRLKFLVTLRSQYWQLFIYSTVHSYVILLHQDKKIQSYTQNTRAYCPIVFEWKTPME